MKQKKKPLFTLKDLRPEDWRGVLATLIIIGGFATMALAIVHNVEGAIAAVSTLMYAVADWYFKSRERKKK